jgi:hypothetical protein
MNDPDDIERMQKIVRDDFKRRMLEHDPLLTDRQLEELIREALKEPLQ